MEINRENYQAFLLDLLEGALTPEKEREVRDFLSKHPDCAEGFQQAEPWALDPFTVRFPGKDRLIKTLPDRFSLLTPFNFDMFSIARLEGDLTPEQEADHERMVEGSPERLSEWLEWKSTKLTAEAVSWPEKSKLKKPRTIQTRTLWIGLVSAAATVVLVLTLVRNHRELSEQLYPEKETAGNAIPGSIPGYLSQTGANRPMPDETEVPLSETGKLPAGNVAMGNRMTTYGVTIRKNPDPPELTGLDQSAHSVTVLPGPIKLSAQGRQPAVTPPVGKVDRISRQELMASLPAELPEEDAYTLENGDRYGLAATTRKFIREKDLSLLTVASAGISEISRITGSGMSLDLSRGANGTVSGFSFRSSLLSVAAPVEKAQ
jgi:hypothetical protein